MKLKFHLQLQLASFRHAKAKMKKRFTSST